MEILEGSYRYGRFVKTNLSQQRGEKKGRHPFTHKCKTPKIETKGNKRFPTHPSGTKIWAD